MQIQANSGKLQQSIDGLDSICKTGAKRSSLEQFLLLGLHTSSKQGWADRQAEEMSADKDLGKAMKTLPENDSMHVQGPLAEPKRADVSAPAQAPGRNSFANSGKLQNGIEMYRGSLLNI